MSYFEVIKIRIIHRREAVKKSASTIGVWPIRVKAGLPRKKLFFKALKTFEKAPMTTKLEKGGGGLGISGWAIKKVTFLRLPLGCAASSCKTNFKAQKTFEL